MNAVAPAPAAHGPLDLLRWVSDSARCESIGLSRAAAAVLQALILTVDNASLQWPRPGAASWEGISLRRLGERAHYSGRHVARALPELERLGVLRVEPRDGRPHVFKLSLARITALWGTMRGGMPAPPRAPVEVVELPLKRRRLVPEVDTLVDCVAQALVSLGLTARMESLLGYLRGGGAVVEGVRRHVGGVGAQEVASVMPSASARASSGVLGRVEAAPTPRPLRDDHRVEALHRLLAARRRAEVEICTVEAELTDFKVVPVAQRARWAREFQDAYRAKRAAFDRAEALRGFLRASGDSTQDESGPEAMARLRAALAAAAALGLDAQP